MTKNYIILITSLFYLNFLNAQTITFGWDTAPVENGNNVTETINGITTTFTAQTQANILDVIGYGGSTGNIVIESMGGTQVSASVTFSFSETVDVTSILALEGSAQSINYTFTPVGGSNSIVVASLVNGAAQVDLNWTNVTSFTVFSTDSAAFGFDNLVITSSTLSTNDFALKTIKVFPNPSTNFIEINGLTAIENYNIYNTLGQAVMKGIILENEKIDIQNLNNGLYFIKFDNGSILKFMKK